MELEILQPNFLDDSNKIPCKIFYDSRAYTYV
jgi:hypothetical protein